jgi:hypothetical protein
VQPQALNLGHRRIRLRAPGCNVALRSLPSQVLVTRVEALAREVVVGGIYTEWQRTVSRQEVQRLLTSLRSGRARVDI